MPFIRKFCLFMTISLIITACGSTQESTEQQTNKGGVLRYKIDVELPGMKEVVDSMYMDYYWGAGISRNHLSMMGVNLNIFHNKDSMLLITKTRKADSLFAMATMEQLQSEFGINKMASVNATDQSKTIGGYKTTPIIFKKDKSTMTLWCASALDIPKTSLPFQHEKMKGFPLKIEMQVEDRQLFLIKAKEVVKEYPGDEYFNLNGHQSYEKQPLEEVVNFIKF